VTDSGTVAGSVYFTYAKPISIHNTGGKGYVNDMQQLMETLKWK
jgi:GTP:adenosylcobinamide-phosphate guanylyltransferase